MELAQYRAFNALLPVHHSSIRATKDLSQKPPPFGDNAVDLSFKAPSPKGEGWDEGELNSSFIQVSLISTYRILKAKEKKLF